MEKIINRGLTWTFEKNGLYLKNQSGFRRGRGTMDNVIALEHFIKEGCNKIQPQNTYAVFLDVAKAFDTTWIQGILYKLSKKGVTGKTLFLNPRSQRGNAPGRPFRQRSTMDQTNRSHYKQNNQAQRLIQDTQQKKHGPNVDSLCIMYKALVRARSRMEYGIMSYGCSSKIRQKRLETIQNCIFRIILGAPSTTPIKELQCELGLTSIENRRTWLSGRFIIRIDKQTQHPLYQNCYNMWRSPKSWKEQNVPSLKTAIDQTRIADIDLFNTLPDYRRQCQEPPPWRESNINIGHLPISKKHAMLNQSAARSLFCEITHRLPETAIKIYTDGSLNPSAKTTTCAVVIPSLSIEEAYTLEENSSIFTVEGYGILKAMELILQHNDPITEITIFIDSKLIIQALNSPGKEKQQIVHSIMQAAEGLRSAGTKATVYWIPSHVGIDGKEKADRLAATESSSNELTNRIHNKLSVNEQCVQLKIHLQNKFLEELKKENNKPNLQLRNKIGLLNGITTSQAN